MNKFFLVEIISDESTRWSEDDQNFAASLGIMTTSAVKTWTDGPQPKVSVTAVRQRILSERGKFQLLIQSRQ